MCIHFGVLVPAYRTLPNTHISLPTSHVSGTKIYKENTKTTNSDGVPKLTSIWWGLDAIHLLRFCTWNVAKHKPDPGPATHLSPPYVQQKQENTEKCDEQPWKTQMYLNGSEWHGLSRYVRGIWWGFNCILRLFCKWHRARHKHEPVPDKPHVPVKFPSLFRPNVHPFWGPCPCI